MTKSSIQDESARVVSFEEIPSRGTPPVVYQGGTFQLHEASSRDLRVRSSPPYETMHDMRFLHTANSQELKKLDVLKESKVYLQYMMRQCKRWGFDWHYRDPVQANEPDAFNKASLYEIAVSNVDAIFHFMPSRADDILWIARKHLIPVCCICPVPVNRKIIQEQLSSMSALIYSMPTVAIFFNMPPGRLLMEFMNLNQDFMELGDTL